MKTLIYKRALESVQEVLKKDSLSFDDRLKGVCDVLRKKIKKYNWVGFYFNDIKSHSLILKTYSGEPTSHKLIPFGSGICGRVAISNKNCVVPNVKEAEGYISCHKDVKSEIVIPIFIEGNNMGQIKKSNNYE